MPYLQIPKKDFYLLIIISFEIRNIIQRCESITVNENVSVPFRRRFFFSTVHTELLFNWIGTYLKYRERDVIIIDFDFSSHVQVEGRNTSHWIYCQRKTVQRFDSAEATTRDL